MCFSVDADRHVLHKCCDFVVNLPLNLWVFLSKRSEGPPVYFHFRTAAIVSIDHRHVLVKRSICCWPAPQNFFRELGGRWGISLQTYLLQVLNRCTYTGREFENSHVTALRFPKFEGLWLFMEVDVLSWQHTSPGRFISLTGLDIQRKRLSVETERFWKWANLLHKGAYLMFLLLVNLLYFSL